MKYKDFEEMLDSIILNRHLMELAKNGLEKSIQSLSDLTKGHFDESTIEMELQAIGFDYNLQNKFNKAKAICDEIYENVNGYKA